MSREEFINEIAGYVKKYAKQFGILVHSPIIAQAILEGTDPDKVAGHNYFGLKYRKNRVTCNNGYLLDGGSEQNKDGSYSDLPTDTAWYRFDSVENGVLGYFQFIDIPNYSNLKGVTDPETYLKNIKADGYATDQQYVQKLMRVINSYGLLKYDEEVDIMGIQIVQDIAMNNPAYRAGRTIDPKGGMLHSVGCPQPNPKVFVNIWKQANAKVCVHAVVGPDGPVHQLLPWKRRAWHCGSGPKGSGNNTLISIELTEPATIKYTGGATWIELGDGSNTKKHVLATYAQAVKFYAQMCKELGFNPSDIISHHEGNVKGIASNHGDVEHVWKKFGLTMNQFRADVKKAMAGQTVSAPQVDNKTDDKSDQKVNALKGTVIVVYKGKDGINIRKAPSMLAKVDEVVFKGKSFTVVGISADEKWYKLEDGRFITTIPDYVSFKATEEQKQSTAGTGYFRVRRAWDKAGTQIGAFKDKKNAIDLCKNNSGYKVFDNNGVEVYPCVSGGKKTQKFEVKILDLRIRKGPGTGFDYHKEGGKPKYTGKGQFTIVETKDGPGADLWGLLKSYEKNRDGWIALDSDYGTLK